MEKIILASASPRRKELMALLPWPYEVITLPVDECLPEDYKGATYVQALALKKARAVAEAYPDRLVIGADTMVCLEGHMLGKPRDILDRKSVV